MLFKNIFINHFMQKFIDSILSPAVILNKSSDAVFMNKEIKSLFSGSNQAEHIKYALSAFLPKITQTFNGFPSEIKAGRIKSLNGLYDIAFFPVSISNTEKGAMVLISKSELKISREKLLHELELINKVITNVTSSLDMDDVLSAIFAQLMNEYKFDGICIQLLDEENMVKTMKIYYEGASDDELEELKNLSYPLLSANRSIKEVLINAKYYVDENTLYLPLIVQKKIIGLLSVSHFRDGFSLTEEDIKSVKRHADYISVALNNSTLYGQIKKVNRKLEEKDKIITSDLMLAKRIQQNILGSKINTYDNLDIFIDYLPFMDVGGDYYDICSPDKDIIRIFIADATGHGVPAGLITMLIKSEYEKLKLLKAPPSKLLDSINKIFTSTYMETGVFLTGFITDISTSEKKITYSSAGHPPIVLIRENKIEKLTTKGSLIGLLTDSLYSDETHKIENGDKLLLYTDGIFEEFNDIDQIFGEERLYKIIDENKSKSLREIKSEVFNAVKNFTSRSTFEDDVTLIGITYKEK